MHYVVDLFFLCLYFSDNLEESNLEMQGATPGEEHQTAETHKKLQAHFQKEQEFRQYKNLYVAQIYPFLMKEDELCKTVEDCSSSGERRRMDDVALDLERLERCRSIVNSEVQRIESSLNWSNTCSLLMAIEELKEQMQRTGTVLEQGILKI